MKKLKKYLKEQLAHWEERKEYFEHCYDLYHADTYIKEIKTCKNHIESLKGIKKFLEENK